MSAMTLGRPARSLSTWIAYNADLSFAILLAVSVYTYFALTNGLFATHNTAFAIFERFAVLGPVALSLTLCIIAGEIDLSVGSNAALTAVIVVRYADSLGAVSSIALGLTIATLIGVLQGFLIAHFRVRAIVLTVGTLMLLRGVALFVAEEKTVSLTDFDVPDFIQTRILHYFSPASLLTIALFIVVGLFMDYTKYGREIYAIGGARKEALAAGIGLRRPMVIVFAISGFCAGLGGAAIGLRSGTAQALGLQYLLLSGTVAAFIGGVSILGGRGGAIGAAIGTLTVNFLDTGLVFNVTPAYIVQLCLGVLLIVVIMFQTGSHLLDLYQKRQALLTESDQRRVELRPKIARFRDRTLVAPGRVPRS
jgi:ribose/xylose/arabinose/galactoside ABC-type transport system permease subunit